MVGIDLEVLKSTKQSSELVWKYKNYKKMQLKMRQKYNQEFY